MKAFIASNFIVLFAAFYVMSGGPDFVPNEVSPFAEGRAAPEIPTVVASAEPAPAAQPSQNQIVLASAAKIAPAPVSSASKDFGVATQALATIGEQTDKAIALTAPVEAATRASVDLTSLAVTAPEKVEEPILDMRKVVASRVNMRNGPGTRFDVITTLNRDEEVEVLRGADGGWVRLRTQSGRVGWMAERLLSKKYD
jgi:hypothetical protein